MKTELHKRELIFSTGGLKKYSTDVDGIFIYDVQNGWGWLTSILSEQKDNRSDWFGEKSIINLYKDCFNFEFVVLLETAYTKGLKSVFIQA